MIFRFFKNLAIFSHEHYFKLMNATFLDITRRDAKLDALWKDFYNLYISVKDNAFPESTRVEQIKTRQCEIL